MTYREKAIKFTSEGNIKEALKIAKQLDVTYNKEELRVLDIAYESTIGNASFYKQLGVDLNDNNRKALLLLNRLKKIKE